MKIKELLTVLTVLNLPLATVAQPASRPVYFNQSDGTSRVVWFSDIDSALFAADNTYGTFFMSAGRSSASYSLTSYLDSITFATPAGGIAVSDFPQSADFDVVFDSSDENSWTSVSEKVVVDEDNSEYDDFYENFTPKSSITIVYQNGKATPDKTVDGVEISVSGAHVTVTSQQKMRYILKGTSTDGSFKVNCPTDPSTGRPDKKYDKKMLIELNGLDLTNPNGSAINIQSGKSVYVKLASGTVNKLKDGVQYVSVSDEDQKSTLFSEGQLIISGSGSLTVSSLSAHGICSDDYIRLRSDLGNLTVTSASDGINTKQHFLMYGGKVSLNAGDDGISVRKGWFRQMGGKLKITSADKGVDVTYSSNDTTYFDMQGGFLKVETTGEKGHGISCSGRMDVSNAILQILVKGNASKAINCYGNLTFASSKLTLQTQGSSIYNDEEKDYSSAAGIRSRGKLAISDCVLGIKSTGAGGKGINGDGNVSFSGTSATILAKGSLSAQGGESVRPRALECVGLIVSSGCILNLSATHSSISNDGFFNLRGGEVFAFSSDESVKIVKTKETFTQSGGLLYESR